MKITGRVLEVTHKSFKMGDKDVDKWEVSVQEGNETKHYDCYNKKIADMQGKEIEYTTEPGKGNYNAKMKLVDGEQKPFPRGGGKPFDEKQQNTMVLSYTKDIVIALINRQTITSQKEIDEAIINNYNRLHACLNPITSEKIPF